MKVVRISSTLLAVASLFSTLCFAQLSGKVGPLTSTASKAAKKVCNVLNYGAKADQKTDLGPALASAFSACKNGGIVWIPSGNYAMASWQTLNGGTGWALQLDGIIYRTGTGGGHMIVVENANDFEFFSLTSTGAMQGYGYTFLSKNTYGPRLIRLVKVQNFSFHDIALVDSPAFHLIVDTCVNGEIYNVIIRGANRGGLDGIDSSGTNLWYHDIAVTNKDECVTIKTPSSYTLVEDIHCNWSGGCAFGSLGTGTAISNIQYNNIYTSNSNQMIMIKSNGGDGYVKNCSFSNFAGYGNAYNLQINQYWTDRKVNPGNGVQISNLKFVNFSGTISSPSRGSISLVCADKAPCTGVTLENINFWTDTNTAMHYLCESAYGSGYCVRNASLSSGAYKSTSTVSTAPTGYNAVPRMADDLHAGLGLSVSIAIPTIPTSFFPGQTPRSRLLNGLGAGAGAQTSGGSESIISASRQVIATPRPKL